MYRGPNGRYAQTCSNNTTQYHSKISSTPSLCGLQDAKEFNSLLGR